MAPLLNVTNKMKLRYSGIRDVSLGVITWAPPLVPFPPCPQHCRDTTKNVFHLCVHQPSPQLQSPVLSIRVGLQPAQSPGSRDGGGEQSPGNTC